jgi:hypothetical protein
MAAANSSKEVNNARNFRISLMLIGLILITFVFFAYTHISLNRDEINLRIGRRSIHLQNQIELMLEKHRKVEEFQKLALNHMETREIDKPTNDEPISLATSDVNVQGLSDPTSSKFKLAKELSARFHTRYWLELREKWPKDPLPMRQKFLSFEPWNGGFNNIRMSLEMAAAMAMALDRTLVLPPRYKMYLRGESSFQDYFDYDDLRKGFSTITYQEFREKMNLKQYDGFGPDGPNNGRMPEYFQALGKMSNAVILKDGHPLIGNKIASQLVLCFPDCPTNDKDKDKSWFNGAQYRLHPVDTSKHPDVFDTPEVIHFTPILLGHFYTLVWFRDPRIGAKVKRAVRDHIHFREELFVLAEKVINALGGDFSFSCLHIRRNDFQFKEVWTPAEEIVKNVGGLWENGETIYIATDELSISEDKKGRLWNDPLAMSTVKTEHAWFKPMFDAWGGREKVKFWNDFYLPLGLDKDIKKIWIGSVESIVCSRARTFVGTQKSTFSGYIHRMRGYMNDVGQKEPFEAQATYPHHYYHSLVGASWSRFPHGAFGGGHPYWGREYKEAWEGVYNPLY